MATRRRPARRPTRSPARAVARRPRRRGTSLIWYVALAALVLLVGGIGWGIVRVLDGQVEYDAATLCPADGAMGRLVILLDLTDPLGATQTATLRQRLDAAIAAAPEQTMISAGVVSADPANWGARFARCKPATGEDANLIYENPGLIREAFARDFLQPLDAAVSAMMTGQTEDASPIIESLQALIAATPAARPGAPLTVMIVSDLIQNSDTLSFYRGEGWEAFEASGAASRLAATLDGAQVVLMRVPRPQAGGALDLIDDFWSRYLDRQGARAPFDVQTLGDL